MTVRWKKVRIQEYKLDRLKEVIELERDWEVVDEAINRVLFTEEIRSMLEEDVDAPGSDGEDELGLPWDSWRGQHGSLPSGVPPGSTHRTGQSTRSGRAMGAGPRPKAEHSQPTSGGGHPGPPCRGSPMTLVVDAAFVVATTLFPYGPLAGRIWELRNTVTAYDAYGNESGFPGEVSKQVP